MAMNPRLLRPKASGAWTPKRISGLQGWWDASDASTVTLNGSNVSAWADKSGNSRTASQTTAASQPTWGADGKSIVVSVAVSGTAKRLSLASQLTLTGDFTLFAAMSATLSADTILSIFDNSSSSSVTSSAATPFYYNGWPGWYTGLKAGGAPNLTSTTQAFPRFFMFRRSGTAGRFMVRATNYDFTASSATVAIDDIVGGRQITLSRNQIGYEFLIYNVALSDDDATKISDYLTPKWGL